MKLDPKYYILHKFAGKNRKEVVLPDTPCGIAMKNALVKIGYRVVVAPQKRFDFGSDKK